VQARTGTAGLIKFLVKDAKEFFTDLLKVSADKLAKNKFNVEVKNFPTPPEVQTIDGEVSLKDTKALLTGLNEIIKVVENTKKNVESQTKQLEKSLKPEKTDFSSLEKAVKAIEIPKPLESVSIDNQIDYNKKLDDIKKEICKLKLDPQIKVETKASDVVIDLEGIKKLLQGIVESLGTKEEDMIGLVFKKDEYGSVTDIIEKYPSGNVVSSGWNLGVIGITDGRKSS
jgi:hypothetical protein